MLKFTFAVAMLFQVLFPPPACRIQVLKKMIPLYDGQKIS